jgi:HD-GYP domain-containing protein (c-di-GMP phosphodiesterase class II)
MAQFERAEGAFRAVHAASTREELAETLEKQSRELLHAEAAVFFSLEEEDRLMLLSRRHGQKKARVRCPVTQGVAGAVARDNGYYICNHPSQDPLYLAMVDGLEGQKTRNLLAAAAAAGEDDVAGVVEVFNREEEFEEEDAYWLQRLAGHGALALRRLERLEEGWSFALSLASAFAAAVDGKHLSTLGHSERVRQVAVALGRRAEMGRDELLELELAALLHDLGRAGLNPEAMPPTSIGTGYGGPQECLHVALTEALLRGLKLPEYLKQLPELAVAHHERPDGLGFPRGRKGEELPLSARILAVANAFDLLATGRALEGEGQRQDEAAALRSLQAGAGRFYDREVAELVDASVLKLEKRQLPRCESQLEVEVTVLGGKGEAGRPFRTKAVDLSETGVMVRTERELPAQALLGLKLFLPTETLSALARVARHVPDEKGKGFKAGLYFLWSGRQV